jgi:hypothetical protein
MNVVGHDHISADADAKISCAPTIRDKGFVYFGFREQPRTRVSIECDEVDRCIGALKEQIQSRGLIFENTAHGKRCNAQYSQRTSSEILALSQTPLRQRTLQAQTPLETVGCSVRCPQRSLL